MILFVFEGAKREPELFRTIETLFLSDYKSLDFLTLSTRRTPTGKELISRKENWLLVISQNVAKSNYICSGKNMIPEDKDAINQQAVFNAQQEIICETDSVSILSAFPLFLFEYFPIHQWESPANRK